MICIGVDPGQKRVGIALGQGELAIGIATVERDQAISEIVQIATEKSATRIYVASLLRLAVEKPNPRLMLLSLPGSCKAQQLFQFLCWMSG